MHAPQTLNHHIAQDGFRLRGEAFSRIDAFSDVVFGFALTLLVVSLEVPHSFAELHRSLRGFLPFAICFLLLILLWYSHYKFFRRFGLHDTGTIIINATLLFVVLFYVYPLKFLFTVLTNAWIGNDASAYGSSAQMRELLILYGVGFMAVYLLFAALYWNAWRQRNDLQLNRIEAFLTRSAMLEYTSMAAVGLISILIALLAARNYVGIAGWIYVSLTFVGMAHGRWERSALKRLYALPA